MLQWPKHLIFQTLKGSKLRSQGLDLAEIQLIQDAIVILVTAKNEEDLIKIEDAGVAATLKIDFSNILWQLTPQFRVESGSNSNSSKMLWLSLLLPRMKKIGSKLKALEWPQYKN